MTQQKLGSYLSLCTQFYDLIRPEPPEDAYAFYRSYVSNAVGSILEPMCGTGRFLLPLLHYFFWKQLVISGSFCIGRDYNISNMVYNSLKLKLFSGEKNAYFK